MDRKEHLTQRAAQIDGEIRAVQAAVEAQNRPSTGEELAQVAALNSEFNRVRIEIEQLDQSETRAAVLSKPQPRVTDTAVGLIPAVQTSTPISANGATAISGGTQVAHGFANHGFKMGMGEYLVAIRAAKVFGKVDPRLMVNAVTTFGGETVGADGGYALPPQFAQGIMSLAMAEDSFLRALQPVPTSSNLLVVPTDEDPPWGSSGVTAARTGEGVAITASKAKVKKLNVVIHGVKAMVHVSEESLSDIPFLATFVQNKMAQKLRWKMENYAVNGTGQDEPCGILNAPGLLALTDVDSTATDIGAKDIFAMLAACLPGTGCFWLVSPTIMPFIWGLKSGTNGFPLFTPDMTKSPNGTLMGLPIFKSEACPAVNTTGDIMMVCPEGYIYALNGSVQTQTTIAFAFDQDLQSFKSTVRMGGTPTLSDKVTRANGTTYASNLIALAGSRS